MKDKDFERAVKLNQSILNGIKDDNWLAKQQKKLKDKRVAEKIASDNRI